MASGRVIIVSDGSSLLARAPVSDSTSGSAASSGASRRLRRDDNRSWLAARMARENASSQSLRTDMEYLFSARLVGLGGAAGMFAVLGKLQSPLQMIFDFRQGLAGGLVEGGIAAGFGLFPEQWRTSPLILDLDA